MTKYSYTRITEDQFHKLAEGKRYCWTEKKTLIQDKAFEHPPIKLDLVLNVYSDVTQDKGNETYHDVREVGRITYHSHPEDGKEFRMWWQATKDE